jgi:GNAT superfamily N-acetyltransferase
MNTIRHATLEDAAAIAALITELGYPCDESEMRSRLEPLVASTEELVAVALDAESAVAGVIHVSSIRSLEAPLHAEIRALVVTGKQRSAGTGAALVAAGEAWARARAFPRIRVRSRTERERARRFYEREGYAVTKTQNVFEKKL